MEQAEHGMRFKSIEDCPGFARRLGIPWSMEANTTQDSSAESESLKAVDRLTSVDPDNGITIRAVAAFGCSCSPVFGLKRDMKTAEG